MFVTNFYVSYLLFCLSHYLSMQYIKQTVQGKNLNLTYFCNWFDHFIPPNTKQNSIPRTIHSSFEVLPTHNLLKRHITQPLKYGDPIIISSTNHVQCYKQTTDCEIQVDINYLKWRKPMHNSRNAKCDVMENVFNGYWGR